MKPLLRLASTRLALVVSTAAGLLMCGSQLLGVPGVESALVLGVLLPPFVAAASARSVVRARRDGLALDARALVARPLGLGALVVGAPIALLVIDSLRVRACEPWLGLAFMILGPCMGCLVAATAGALVAAWWPRPGWATALAALLPIGDMAAGVYTFWSSPAVFVYSHAAGWFPGTLYDEGVQLPVAYLGFRGCTLMLMAGLWLLASAVTRPSSGRPSLRMAVAAWQRTLVALLLLGGVVAAEVEADELGQRSSSTHIADELGVVSWGRRCVIHAPRELPARELRRMVSDCDFRVEESEHQLGVHQRARLHAFFFRSAEEKQRVMGAARTFIAKPWRDEVYLQLEGWPHPVLHHEVAHVVAGNVARGPFRVGGTLGGWLPDPALIEGVAVAVAWDPRDGLTPHQWAHAMLELGLMPPLRDVMGLSFLRQPARNAYTVAGSFMRWLLDVRGAAVVREAYRSGDIEAAAGTRLGALERQWHRFLRQESLPQGALALARLRFSQRSIFSSVCPHRVARLKEQLGGDLASGDDRRALETCGEILDIDPDDVVTRARRAGALARTGDATGALDELSKLSGEAHAPRPVLALARQGIADAAWRAGHAEAALAMYRVLLSEPQTEAAARAVEVRVMGIEAGGAQARLVFDILVGTGGAPTPGPVTVHLAHTLSGLRADGLGAYLEARQMIFSSRFDQALPLVREARRRGLSSVRLRREARRMQGQALFALGRLEEAEGVWREALEDPTSDEGDRVTSRDWLARIAWTRASR